MLYFVIVYGIVLCYIVLYYLNCRIYYCCNFDACLVFYIALLYSLHFPLIESKLYWIVTELLSWTKEEFKKWIAPGLCCLTTSLSFTHF